MEKVNEKYLIEQILPYYITAKIPIKKGICIQIEKKLTTNIIKILKQKDINLDSVYLKDNNFLKQNLNEYEKSSFDNNINNEYIIYDCSFLKRVKNLNDSKNLILISFKEDIEYKKINLKDLCLELKILEKDILEYDIPSIQPISNEQYEEAKAYWPISCLISPKEKYIYQHNLEEENKILNIYNNLKNDEKGFTCYLYNPKNDKILCKGKKNNKSLIEHDIMNLLNNYSNYLKDSENENFHFNLGVKNEKGPKENTDLLFNQNLENNLQYYCENLYIICINEPCIMCSMALVHNRISRIYFEKENKEDGGLISKLKLNDYNLNHHYLIYKIISKDNN